MAVSSMRPGCDCGFGRELYMFAHAMGCPGRPPGAVGHVTTTYGIERAAVHVGQRPRETTAQDIRDACEILDTQGNQPIRAIAAPEHEDAEWCPKCGSKYGFATVLSGPKGPACVKCGHVVWEQMDRMLADVEDYATDILGHMLQERTQDAYEVQAELFEELKRIKHTLRRDFCPKQREEGLR
jgi:hypothetical protein